MIFINMKELAIVLMEKFNYKHNKQDKKTITN
jgi:hypothetical protein